MTDETATENGSRCARPCLEVAKDRMGGDVAGPQRSCKAGLSAQDGRAMDGHRARRERRPAHRHAMPAPSIRNADVGPRRRADPAQCVQRHAAIAHQLLSDRRGFALPEEPLHVRQNRDSLLRRINKRHGHERLSDIKARVLLAWHKDWSADGKKLATARPSSANSAPCSVSARPYLKIPTASAYVASCTRCALQERKPARQRHAEYANMIRATAHDHFGWHSIALGQAFQFECTLRQKDVIGEWVPLSEPGVSAVIIRGRNGFAASSGRRSTTT
jgi:hypothetical protein